MAQRTQADPIDDGSLAEPGAGFDVLTPDEARAVFDADIRRLLGISGDEFLRRYDAGEIAPFDDDGENARVVSAILSIPLVRPWTLEEGSLRLLD
jgi:hypothetical protein